MSADSHPHDNVGTVPDRLPAATVRELSRLAPARALLAVAGEELAACRSLLDEIEHGAGRIFKRPCNARISSNCGESWDVLREVGRSHSTRTTGPWCGRVVGSQPRVGPREGPGR
jgi:hypothetical protein